MFIHWYEKKIQFFCIETPLLTLQVSIYNQKIESLRGLCILQKT